jgi:2,3-bisphosphoglycerate-independent phosphoglycerate mutase
MQPRKILVVVMDGLGDRAVKDLHWKTPLQAANRPNLNWFAEHGATGIVDIISPGVRPGSDTSHLAILGYDPYQVYTGRGPFEAAGTGLVGEKGDVAFRCNFATVDPNLVVTDRRAGRIKEPDTTMLVESLSGMSVDGVDIVVKEATEHRAVLLLRGKGLSAKVSDVDPHTEAKIHESQALEHEAKKTAKVVNHFVQRSYELLNDHPVNQRRRLEGKPPANILLPRGAGVFPDIQAFQERYQMTGACVAGVSLIKGICRVCGLDVIEVQGATGGMDTDMVAKAKAAVRLLDTYDFVLVNVKAADVASHDGNANLKVKVIERLDEMAGVIRSEMPEGTVVAFLADHCTPIEVKDHSGDPVPLLIYCQGMVRDANASYDEASCAHGGLGRLRGKDILPILIDKAGRSEKFGA